MYDNEYMLALNVFRDTPMVYFVTEKHRLVGIDSKVYNRFRYVHTHTDYYRDPSQYAGCTTNTTIVITAVVRAIRFLFFY
jgi:hypothetical protein